MDVQSGEYKEALKLTKNAICINNGIDINALNKITKDFTEKEIDFENLKICTIGRIGCQKNPELFNKIAESFPKFQFTWIGEGQDKNLLTSSNIKVTGWVDKNEVLKILNENDIFVLTSLWEGLPIALLEAMYLKKICIVNNCIGNRDAIKNKKSGFVCNNLDEFIETINALNKIDVGSIKSNEFKDINEVFNLSKMASEYRKVYDY